MHDPSRSPLENVWRWSKRNGWTIAVIVFTLALVTWVWQRPQPSVAPADAQAEEDLVQPGEPSPLVEPDP
jgi:hypothetical protein